MHTADKLTLCRIFAAPVFFALYRAPVWAGQTNGFLFNLSAYALIPFLILAEITDYFDGKFARAANQVSGFGKVFDPFADVFLNITVFFCLLLSGYMPPFILLLIIYREFGMTFIRLVAIQRGVAIGARKGGKVKTVLYVTSCFFTLALECAVRLGFLSAADPRFSSLKTAALVLFVLCLIASYTSFIDYLLAFKSVIGGNEEKTGKNAPAQRRAP
jgi:CDP-diacylglycerol--glycerol-3-phosphate 3-phosphatidyltransferase